MQDTKIDLKDWRIESGLGGVPPALSGAGSIQVEREGDSVVIECETPSGQMLALVIEFDAGHARIRIHPPSEQDVTRVHDEAVVNLVAVQGGVIVGNGHASHGLLYQGENRIERCVRFNGDRCIKDLLEKTLGKSEETFHE